MALGMTRHDGRDERPETRHGMTWGDQEFPGGEPPIALAGMSEGEMAALGWVRRETYLAERERRMEAERVVWDDSVAPGGDVCASCGVPTESEPCQQHSPQVIAERVRVYQAALQTAVDAMEGHDPLTKQQIDAAAVALRELLLDV